MKNNKNKIQPLNPTLHRLRATLPDKNIQKVFIQDFLKLKVKELHPITETTDKWDMDLIQKHYYTIAKSLVTLDDNHKIIVRIAYFSRDDLLKDWEADIITTGTELLWKSLSLSDEELKSDPLIPTYAIAITHSPQPNSFMAVKAIKDDNGHIVESSAFPDKRAAKIAYFSFYNAAKLK